MPWLLFELEKVSQTKLRRASGKISLKLRRITPAYESYWSNVDERGIEYEAIRSAFTDPARSANLIDASAYRRQSRARNQILQQVALMQQADIIVLNEVDWGMKRTDYRNVTADLAAALRLVRLSRRTRTLDRRQK